MKKKIDKLEKRLTAATARLKEARDHMKQMKPLDRKTLSDDETLAMIVTADFPDEKFETFDEWRAAMDSDDTAEDTSPLWHGGGQWLLYSLGLLLKVRLVVVSLHPDLVAGSGFVEGASQASVSITPACLMERHISPITLPVVRKIIALPY